MGKLIVDAIRQLDAPVVEGGVMFFAVIFVLINILIDMLYTIIDPRIRLT